MLLQEILLPFTYEYLIIDNELTAPHKFNSIAEKGLSITVKVVSNLVHTRIRLFMCYQKGDKIIYFLTSKSLYPLNQLNMADKVFFADSSAFYAVWSATARQYITFNYRVPIYHSGDPFRE